MDKDEAWYRVAYYGDSCHPQDGEHDLHALVCEAVCRLPENVQDWLLDDTKHIFIGGSGQLGEAMHWLVDIKNPTEVQDDRFAVVRVIFLSEQLLRMPKDEGLWTIAHEIAHSRLNYLGDEHHRWGGGYEAEVKADALAEQWGFQAPPDAAARREKYRLKGK